MRVESYSRCLQILIAIFPEYLTLTTLAHHLTPAAGYQAGPILYSEGNHPDCSLIVTNTPLGLIY
jgi:hypothetical protein